MVESLTDTIKSFFPEVQAIYLFGSYADGTENDNSDIDIALLLPHEQSKREQSLAMSPVRFELEKETKRNVDVVNLRQVSTVFQKEIVVNGKRIYCRDEYGAETFEMLVLSLYVKLNEERAGILEDFVRTKRAYKI
jgi:uncharacterized protein